jgi:hypothetical protein
MALRQMDFKATRYQPMDSNRLELHGNMLSETVGFPISVQSMHNRYSRRQWCNGRMNHLPLPRGALIRDSCQALALGAILKHSQYNDSPSNPSRGRDWRRNQRRCVGRASARCGN